MKKAILFMLFCCSFIFATAQLDKPNYLIFDIGKQTPPSSFFFRSYDGRSSLLLGAGMGYEHPINEKAMWVSEFSLGYRHEKNISSFLFEEMEELEEVDTTILVLRTLKNKNLDLEFSIPIYLKYRLNNGLILTGGVHCNFSLLEEYVRTTITRNRTESGGTRTRSNPIWFGGLQMVGNIGLQVPISNYADLRFNLQQPVWTASFKGFGSGLYRFSNLRFTFGLNYKLGQTTG